MFTGKKTVSSILAAFTKTIEDLKGVTNSNMDAAAEKRGQVQQLKEEIDGHIAEARHALEVSERLQGIIQPG